MIGYSHVSTKTGYFKYISVMEKFFNVDRCLLYTRFNKFFKYICLLLSLFVIAAIYIYLNLFKFF